MKRNAVVQIQSNGAKKSRTDGAQEAQQREDGKTLQTLQKSNPDAIIPNTQQDAVQTNSASPFVRQPNEIHAIVKGYLPLEAQRDLSLTCLSLAGAYRPHPTAGTEAICTSCFEATTFSTEAQVDWKMATEDEWLCPSCKDNLRCELCHTWRPSCEMKKYTDRCQDCHRLWRNRS